MQADLLEKTKNNVPGTGRHFSSKSTSALLHDGLELAHRSCVDSRPNVQQHADFPYQGYGCTTSMAWLPWVMAAEQVGCPAALKGVFCTADSAPVEGLRARPDTVLPRKFAV
jgi:hypothetical protein